MSKKRKETSRAVPGEGDACPKCRRPMQIREHIYLREKQLKAPYYFSRWFVCTNPKCTVTQHMAERFKILNQNRVEWTDAELSGG